LQLSIPNFKFEVNIVLMKRVTTFIFVILLSSCSKRIGDFTVLANRNIEFEKRHVNLKRNVSGSSTRLVFLNIPFGKPNIEEAVDEIIRNEGTGEYVANAELSMVRNWYLLFGTWGFKVRGDLMGYEGQKSREAIKKEAKDQKQLEEQENQRKLAEKFLVGDKVIWTNLLKETVQGEITGKGEKEAVVKTSLGKIVKVNYEKLTKVE
jgi:hypothetical protein